MTPLAASLTPARAAALAEWHRMLAGMDLSELPKLLHPEVRFRSPMVHKPYEGAAITALILQTVATVFEDFAYERAFASDDGASVGLEFRARVGDRDLKGIDLIRFDETGKIVEFEVMVRPHSGLVALGERMAKKLGK
jgi:hypothetical protein